MFSLLLDVLLFARGSRRFPCETFFFHAPLKEEITTSVRMLRLTNFVQFLPIQRNKSPDQRKIDQTKKPDCSIGRSDRV